MKEIEIWPNCFAKPQNFERTTLSGESASIMSPCACTSPNDRVFCYIGYIGQYHCGCMAPEQSYVADGKVTNSNQSWEAYIVDGELRAIYRPIHMQQNNMS
jgi:hypothetical protein